MLKSDLERRASEIWGSAGIRKISIRADGGVTVEVARGVKLHRLNFVGRPVCHKQCERYDAFLASAATAQKG